MRLVLLFAFAVCSVLRGDALDEVRFALKGLKAQSAVRVSVQSEGWEREESKKPESFKHSFEVTDGPGGPAFVQQTAAKEKHEVSAKEVTRAHEVLLETLDSAKLLEVRPELFQGKPARRLRLALAALEDPEDRKHFKKFDLELVLWVGPDNLPFRAEQRVDLEGRVMLFIRFWSKGSDIRTFQLHGDRLLLTSRQTEAQGKAMGKEAGGQGTLRATLVKAP